MTESKYPAGWDEQRVVDLIAHYETQSEKEAVEAMSSTTRLKADVADRNKWSRSIVIGGLSGAAVFLISSFVMLSVSSEIHLERMSSDSVESGGWWLSTTVFDGLCSLVGGIIAAIIARGSETLAATVMILVISVVWLVAGLARGFTLSDVAPLLAVVFSAYVGSLSINLFRKFR